MCVAPYRQENPFKRISLDRKDSPVKQGAMHIPQIKQKRRGVLAPRREKA
jgi:hypothetical protein